jgi:hypothetical protein
MSSNFQGLGFSFSAKDAGLQRYLKTTSSLSGEMSQSFDKFGSEAGKTSQKQGLVARGFTFIADSVGTLWGLMKKAGSSLFSWVVNAPGKLKAVADQVANLAIDGSTLTTSFEAQAQAANVSSRKVLAATGIFGKALDKATGKAAGLSMGMKVSEQTAGHAVASMEQFGTELKSLGIESAETAVKLEDGLGVSSRDLAFNFHKVRVGLKLSEKDLDDVSRSFTATGEAIHDMVHPLQNMPQLLELAQRRSNLVAQGMSSIGGKDSIKSINRATQALFILTGDSKGAQEGALALEQKMVESMENFRNMFAGTSTDLDAFLTNTSVVTGDVRKAFEAAEKGPDAFIKEFGGVIAKLKKDGKNTSDILKFFGGRMSEALGPELANTIVTALSNADSASMKTIDGMKTVGKSIGEVAKESWRSSMTLSESFQLMTGAAMSSFRDISRGAAVAFVKDTGASFAEFNKSASALVKQGGPLGAIVEKMSLISQIGALALVPKSLRPTAQVFGTIYKEVMPVVESFGKLQGSVLGILGPIGAVVGALTFLHSAYKDTEVSAKKAGKTVGQVWGGMVSKFVKQVKSFFTGAGSFMKDLGNEIGDVFKNIDWKEIGSALFEIWDTIIAAVTKAWHDYIKPFAKGLWDAITGAVDPKSAEGLTGAQKMGASVGFALASAAKWVKDGATKLWNSVIQWWRDNGPAIERAAIEAFDSVVNKIKVFWNSPETQKKIDEAIGFIEGAFKNVAKSAYDWIAGWLKGQLSQAWDEIKRYATSKVAEMIGPIADDVYKLLAPFRAVRDEGVNAFNTIKSTVDKIFGHSVNTVVGADMDKTVKVVEDAAANIIKGLEQGIFDSIVKGLTTAFTEGFKISMNVSKKFFASETAAFVDFLNNVVGMFRRAWGVILTEIDEAVAASKASTQSAFEDLKKLQTAVHELQNMRVALAEAQKGTNLTSEQRKAQIRAMSAAEMQQTLLDQTMFPDWYMKDYRDRFDGGISEIVNAIQGIKSVQIGGGSGAAGILGKKFNTRASQPLISGVAGVDQTGMSGAK